MIPIAIASGCGVASQLYKSQRSKSVQGISFTMWLLGTMGLYLNVLGEQGWMFPVLWILSQVMLVGFLWYDSTPAVYWGLVQIACSLLLGFQRDLPPELYILGGLLNAVMWKVQLYHTYRLKQIYSLSLEMVSFQLVCSGLWIWDKSEEGFRVVTFISAAIFQTILLSLGLYYTFRPQPYSQV